MMLWEELQVRNLLLKYPTKSHSVASFSSSPSTVHSLRLLRFDSFSAIHLSRFCSFPSIHSIRYSIYLSWDMMLNTVSVISVSSAPTPPLTYISTFETWTLSLSLSLSAWNLISVSSLYFIYHASVHSLRFIRLYSFTSIYSHRFISWVHLFDLFSSLHFLRYSLFLKKMSTCLPQLSSQPPIVVRPQPHRFIPLDT
jgi:hypothetical protein